MNMCDLLLQTLLWIMESVDSVNKDGMDIHMFNVMHCIKSNNSQQVHFQVLFNVIIMIIWGILILYAQAYSHIKWLSCLTRKSLKLSIFSLSVFLGLLLDCVVRPCLFEHACNMFCVLHLHMHDSYLYIIHIVLLACRRTLNSCPYC